MARKKIGLALSGGAARGFAHIGVLKVLIENDIPIDMVAGTSAGSIVGAALASGMSIDDMLKMSSEIRWGDVGRPSLSPMGLLSSVPMARYLARHLPVDRFEDLKIPFAAIACDPMTGDEVVLKDKGDLIHAVRASCAVPGIFVPPKDGGRLLVDGGAVKPLPCDTVRDLGADVVIAVDVLACGSSFRSNPRTALGVTIMSAMTLIRMASMFQHIHADVVIAPEIAHLRPDELGKRDEFIRLGEKATLESLGEIKKILD
jgi:NTE family protein